jgi:hypothetical protein
LADRRVGVVLWRDGHVLQRARQCDGDLSDIASQFADCVVGLIDAGDRSRIDAGYVADQGDDAGRDVVPVSACLLELGDLYGQVTRGGLAVGRDFVEQRADVLDPPRVVSRSTSMRRAARSAPGTRSGHGSAARAAGWSRN